jgi:hypothetical protein
LQCENYHCAPSGAGGAAIIGAYRISGQ